MTKSKKSKSKKHRRRTSHVSSSSSSSSEEESQSNSTSDTSSESTSSSSSSSDDSDTKASKRHKNHKKKSHKAKDNKKAKRNHSVEVPHALHESLKRLSSDIELQRARNSERSRPHNKEQQVRSKWDSPSEGFGGRNSRPMRRGGYDERDEHNHKGHYNDRQDAYEGRHQDNRRQQDDRRRHDGNESAEEPRRIDSRNSRSGADERRRPEQWRNNDNRRSDDRRFDNADKRGGDNSGRRFNERRPDADADQHENDGDRRRPPNNYRNRQHQNNDRSRSPRRNRKFPRHEDESSKFEWGKQSDGPPPEEGGSDEPPKEKEKPNFGLSGKLTEDTNKVNGVVIKYSEPQEARKPRRRWRLYPFKNEQALPTMHIHRQSCYLIGRDRKVSDVPVDHPSCSKQHAALQYRLVPFERPDGTTGKRVRPYLIDLQSANGTFVNNQPIESQKYVELLEKDVIKFGFSSREYVLLHENSKDDELDDDFNEALVKEEP